MTSQSAEVCLLDPQALVLLAVRLRSRGTIDDVVLTISRLSEDSPVDFRSLVAEMIDDQLLRSRGEIGRLSLTTVGAQRLRNALADTTAQVGRVRVEKAYREFIVVNREFLTAVSTWQTNSAASSVESVGDLVDRVTPAVMSLSSVLPRFSCYLSRFDRALDNAANGCEWIESPLIDSVHTIWFELHEHLLASLELARTDER